MSIRTTIYAVTCALALAACGSDDPPKYKGTITCDLVCDTQSAQTKTPVCATDDDINKALQAGVDECTNQLSTQCASYSCTCTIPDSLPECG